MALIKKEWTFTPLNVQSNKKESKEIPQNAWGIIAFLFLSQAGEAAERKSSGRYITVL